MPAPYTLYHGIRALPAGHCLRVGEQSASGRQASQPFCLITDILAHAAAHPAPGFRADALDAIGATVVDSIASHRVADVPVGMFLSAGINSALITALSTTHAKRPHTLTLAFFKYVGSGQRGSPLAEQLAAQFGTRHATVMVCKADFEEQREQLLAAMDHPSIDGVNTWFVSQAAASHGTRWPCPAWATTSCLPQTPAVLLCRASAIWPACLVSAPSLKDCSVIAACRIPARNCHCERSAAIHAVVLKPFHPIPSVE